MKIAVLGNGHVGSEVAKRLRKTHEVNVFDHIPGDNVLAVDLNVATAVGKIAGEHDLVVGALPAKMGFRTMQAVIMTGTDMVDISFMEEDASDLYSLAKTSGSRVVADMGIAPGVSNILAGHLADIAHQSVTIYVGGISNQPATWPIYHSTAFNLEDTLSEYTRTVRQIEGDRIVTKPPLGGYETFGLLEAFETDGLRSMIDLPFTDLKEKTLRWVGHHEFILQIKEAGFLNDLHVAARCLGKAMRPRDEVERTLLWVVAHDVGDLGIGPRSYVYEDQRPHSLAISTAIAAVVAVNHWGSIQPGVWMPEEVYNVDPFLTWLDDEGLTVETKWEAQ